MTTNQPYSNKVFSSTDLPRIGQRVRTTIGIGSRVYDLPAGTLCDVTKVEGGFVYCDVYLKQSDGTVVTISDGWRPECFESVRGKPFVAGVDDRRREGSNPSGAATATPTAKPLPSCAGGAEDESEDEQELVDNVTNALREALAARRAPVAPPVDLTPITDRLDTLDGRVDAQIDTLIAHAGVLDTHSKNIDTLGELAGALATQVMGIADALAGATPATLARVAVTARAASGKEPLLSAIAPFYTAGTASPVNVLLCSAPSLGKSFAVRKLALSYDAFREHSCSDDIEEWQTLLGGIVPDGRGGFITVDGVLTECVRLASTGQNVLFLIDETLRLPSRAQEALLTFLTGVETPSGRIYRLRTRRALPDGSLEVLTCEARHLHIIGATNLGVVAPVEAFWSRWLKVRVEFEPAIVREVATAVCDSYGIVDSGTLISAFVNIVVESRAAVADGSLRFPVDVRLLVGACATAPDGTGASVGKTLTSRLSDATAHWNLDTGDCLPESKKVCDKWIAALLAL